MVGIPPAVAKSPAISAAIGAKRVAKAVLISAVPPLMLKTEKNPGGLPISVFDGLRAALVANRAEFYKEITLRFTDTTARRKKSRRYP